ncbi:MAG TPA: CCA tRNA nucleotidyltransferase [Candidatus Omnitrophica bacterium]|nr:CCA tRNA nucleotidyltransferase [Candidatus Omnitrophota bacterium]
MLPIFIDMEKLKKFLKLITDLAYPYRVYIVGGLVRDLLLNRQKAIIDCDIVISGNVLKISKDFSEKINGYWFILDSEHEVYRVVDKEGSFRFDFTSMKGEDIYQDLRTRDYTINALAMDITEDFSLGNIIDPLYGQEDLKRRIVRAISEQNLIVDPIRILRGVSLSSELDFEIESGTWKLLSQYAYLLEKEAGERISEELFKILKNKNSFKYFILLNELKILDVIFLGWKQLRIPPPGPYHHLPIDEHSIETLRCLENLSLQIQQCKQLLEYLNEKIREGRTRFEILKLGSLLHDIGKPPAYHVEDGKLKFTGHEKIGAEITRKICQRLKFSNRETDMVCKYVYYHLRPGFLVDCIASSKRAVFRYFRDTENEAVAILLLSLADKEATRGELSDESDIRRHHEIIWDLIHAYFQKKEEIKPPRLITGWDVMEILKIPSGPIVGKILREIEEAQAEKKITTREEAIKYAKAIYAQLSRNVEK